MKAIPLFLLLFILFCGSIGVGKEDVIVVVNNTHQVAASEKFTKFRVVRSSLHDLRDFDPYANRNSVNSGIDSIGAPLNQHQVVYVVVPKSLEAPHKNKFIQLIKDNLQVNAYLKDTPITVQLSFIDVNEAVKEGERANAELEHLQQNTPPGAAREVIGQSIEQNNKKMGLLLKWKDWSLAWYNQLKGDPRKQDLLIGNVVGGIRSVFNSGYWLTVTGKNSFGWTQTMISIVLDQIFSRYVKEYNDFKFDHQIPWYKDSVLVGFYNNTSKFIRAVTLSYLMGLGTSATLRMLSHLNDPQVIATPFSLSFLAQFGGLFLVKKFAGNISDNGIRQLHQKGFITTRVETLILHAVGMLSLINNTMFNSGWIDWLAYGLAVEVVVKGAISIVGHRLPSREKRVFIFHPQVAPQDMLSVMRINGMTVDGDGACNKLAAQIKTNLR